MVVFGSIAALFELAEHSGSRPFSELAQPAIRLAEEGFNVDATFSAMIQWRRAQLELPEVAEFIRKQLRAKSTEKLFHNAAKYVQTKPAQSRGSHSTSLAVVDSDGNIIVATHSINALPWGEGIFVQGIALTAGGQWPSMVCD